MVGRPYGYTEEYQSYEQTGSTTSYTYGASNCGTGCSKFTAFNGLWWCVVNYPASSVVSPGSACPYKTTSPTYGYVTRTRTVTYDKQSGLFSIGIGVPFPSRNSGLYGSPYEYSDYHWDWNNTNIPAVGGGTLFHAGSLVGMFVNALDESMGTLGIREDLGSIALDYHQEHSPVGNWDSYCSGGIFSYGFFCGIFYTHPYPFYSDPAPEKSSPYRLS